MRKIRALAAVLAWGAGACRFGYELLPAADTGQGGGGAAGATGEHALGGYAAAGAPGDAGGASAGQGQGQSGSPGAGGSPQDLAGAPGASGAAAAGDVGVAGVGAAAGAGGAAAAQCGDATVGATEECEPTLAKPEDLCQADCSYAWYDRSYAKRRRLVFDNSASKQALTAFVVPVVLTPKELDYAALMPGGEDLIFVDRDDTSLLNDDVEAYQPGGTSVIWVRIPSIPAGAKYGFWMYFGKPGAKAAGNPQQTWSAAFAAVYHLNGDAKDAAGNNDGVVTAAVAAGGRLASGLDFASTTAGVDGGSRLGVADMFLTGGTISAWIKPRGWGGGNYGRILDKAPNVLTDTGWALQVNGGVAPNHSVIFEHGFSGGVGRWAGPDSAVTLNAWLHVALVYAALDAGTVPLLYLNGVAQALTALNVPAGNPTNDAGHSLGIGQQVATGQRSFDGVLDEVRLERVARSAEWIGAEYRSELPGAVAVGAEQHHL